MPDDVLPGFRVVPAQMSVVSPDEEVEHAAVPLQDPFLDGLDGGWLVTTFRHSVPSEASPVELPRLVEPPVLRNAQADFLSTMSCWPVLRDAISRAKSDGLPCSKMMYPLISQ